MVARGTVPIDAPHGSMAQRDTQDRQKSLVWRIAGGWLVLLALTLATVGAILSIEQAQALGLRLMVPVEAEARRIAAEAVTRFDREVAQLATALQWSEGASGWPDLDRAALPTWVDGVYLWLGEYFATMEPGREYDGPFRSWLSSRLAARPAAEAASDGTSNVLCESTPDGPFAAVLLMAGAGARGGEIVAARIDLALLRGRILNSLLPTDGHLIVAPIGDVRANAPWTQRLFGAFRFWAITPSDDFVRQQKWTVVGQTAVYLALPILALLTMLVAMTVLKRAVRREIALTEMKAHFVADVSHELKTPLALIRLFAETLLSGRVTSEEKRNEYYAIITRESTRLTNLIETILDFARIESGRKQYRMEATDLGEVVRDTYETYRAQLDHDGFDHHLAIAPGLPQVNADRSAIAQIVINLVNNAIKYSDDDRYLAIQLFPDTRRDKHGVVISVQDRGIGISAEDRAHLFDGFFRSADRRVREKGGAGLGLAVVRQIVESHHGTMDVESRLVKGTTFRVFLPCVEDASGPPRPPVQGREPVPSPTSGQA